MLVKKKCLNALQENAALITLGNLKIIEDETGNYPTEVIFAGGALKENSGPKFLPMYSEFLLKYLL